MAERSTNMPWKYLGEFSCAMGAYLVVLFLTVPMKEAAEPGAFKMALALAPTVPLIFVFWTVIREYGRRDEMAKKITAEAFSLGAIVLGFVLTFWGFAETAGWPELPTIFVAPGLFAFWALCLPIVLRRYK